ncbi:MAG: TSUP family transporter [Alphaproteobacteria bacterium]
MEFDFIALLHDLTYNLAWEWLILLFVAAIIAGCVDSIAGGGGLIVLPALLAAGIPAPLALATNKLQSWGGTGYASYYFIKKGLVKPKECKLMILAAFIGSTIGAWLLFYLKLEFLNILIPILLIVVGVYFLFQPNLGKMERIAKLSPIAFALIPAFFIAFYDGFFGPGTGTFLTLAFVSLAGYQLIKATAHAKLLNFISNISAMLYFVLFEQVIWGVGFMMLAGQIIGSMVGSRLVLKQGNRLIRPLLVVISFAIAGKILLEQ